MIEKDRQSFFLGIYVIILRRMGIAKHILLVRCLIQSLHFNNKSQWVNTPHNGQTVDVLVNTGLLWKLFSVYGTIFGCCYGNTTQSGAGPSLPYSQFHAGFNRFMQMAQTDLWGPRSNSTTRRICLLRFSLSFVTGWTSVGQYLIISPAVTEKYGLPLDSDILRGFAFWLKIGI